MTCYLCGKSKESYMAYLCNDCQRIQDIMKLYPDVKETLEFVYLRNETQINNKKDIITKKLKQLKRGKEVEAEQVD